MPKDTWKASNQRSAIRRGSKDATLAKLNRLARLKPALDDAKKAKRKAKKLAKRARLAPPMS